MLPALGKQRICQYGTTLKISTATELTEDQVYACLF